MQFLGLSGLNHLPLAFFVLNLDPIFLHIGPISIHWYGLMYVVAISVALWVLLRYTKRLGIHENQIWGVFVYAAIAGLIGGRLYYVIQQPDLVSHYLLDPINIFSVWNGGMAFFGAIFLASLTVFIMAPRYGISRWVAIDGGAMFAAVGQIFGRVGNVVNGDILGKVVSASPNIPGSVCAHAPCLAYVSDRHILPWAIVYLNPHAFAATHIAYQPAPIYEMGMNIVMLAILWPLRFYLPRLKAGIFFVSYLALYAITQFVVFFARGSEPFTPFLGVNGLKQAQWTAIIVFICCFPLAVIVWRFSTGWPYSEEHPSPLPDRLREGVQPEPANQQTIKSQLVPIAPSVKALATPASSLPEVELPPWRPTRPVGGQLRNLFGKQPPAE